MKSTTKLCVLTLAVAASACRIAAAPDPSSGLGPVAKVFAPVVDEQIGQLFTEPDGLWAFRTTQTSRSDAYEVGRLVVFGDEEEKARHLFAVIDRYEWGVRMQRLDADPVAGRTEGTLFPITQLDAATGKRWGFCAGDGALSAAECLGQGPPGTRWRIYELEADTLVISERNEDRGTLPIELRGQVAVGPFGRDVLAIEPPTRWLAVPGANAFRRPTRPRIVVANGCELGSEHRDALDAQWIRADIKAPKDPLQTSSEAVRLGADALVWCDKAGARVAVPTLYRPRIVVAGRDFELPPMFGVRPVEIGAGARPATDFIARLGAALATGDYATADYVAEQLARRFDFKRPLDRVLVDSMSAIADGGRPEAAARMGLWSTRLQWNPKNSAAWQIGMASIEASLGNRQAAIARTAGLTGVLDALGDEERGAWVAYFWAVSQIRARGATRDYLEPFENFRPLVLAARAQAATDNVDALRGEFESAGAMDVWAALAGTITPLKCETDNCAADVYGRLWMGGDVPAAALSRVGHTHLRPGYKPRESSKDALVTLRDLVAVYPLVDDDLTNDVLQAATDSAVAWVRATCDTAGHDDALRELREVGIDADLRTPNPRPMDATMVWLATRGVTAACGDTPTLASASVDLADEIGVATVPAELLALHIDRAAGGDLLNVLETATSFAIEHEHGDRCATWTVALASAYADAGEFERARDWIQNAARCDVTERQSIDLVSAYLNFQRTSTTSADFGTATRDALRALAHVDVPKDACVGVRELDYKLIGALPDTERTLARRLQIPPAKPNESLSLVTADDRLNIAREHFADVIAALDVRDFPKAAGSLEHARSSFEGVGHEIGIARVRFLESLLFAGNAKGIAKAEVKFEKIGFEPLRKKGVFTELATTNADAKLALALLRDDVATAQPLVKTARNSKSLCEPSPRKMRNVLIDRVDGELQNTRPRDEGPEIELVDP